MSTFIMSYNSESDDFDISGMPEIVLDLIIENLWGNPVLSWVAELLEDERATAEAAAHEKQSPPPKPKYNLMFYESTGTFTPLKEADSVYFDTMEEVNKSLIEHFRNHKIRAAELFEHDGVDCYDFVKEFKNSEN